MSASPNPLVPQGSLQQQSGTAKSKVRVAVFSIVAVHVVLLVGVLMQGGCKKDEPKPEITADQPTAPTDPFHTDPAALAPSNTTDAPIGSTPAPAVDPFAQPGAPAVSTPATPASPMAVSPSAPTPGVVMTPDVIAPVPPTTLDPAPSLQQYTIAKGDNFYTIAKKNNTTTKKIIDANPNVDPAKLKIGQKINVPVSASTPAPATVSGGAAPVAVSSNGGSTTTVTHEVKSGDTLYGIAKKYGTTAKAIKSSNGLKTDRINVGQKLKVVSKLAASPSPEPVISAPASVPVVSPITPLPPATN
ncbi:MAG TPA: LysM peptidoglycan-binding domain-containing protein [Verrucomicrobiae bacterium]